MLRILCISHCLPHPPSTGGNQRTALLMRALSHLGQTDLIHVSRHGSLHPGQVQECRRHFNVLATVDPVKRGTHKPWSVIRSIRPKVVDRLANAFGSQAITYRPDPQVKDVVRRAMAENHYDAVVGRHLYPTAMAGLLHEPPGVPVLIDLDDVDHLVVRENSHRSIPASKRLVFALQRPQIERAVPPLLHAASHLWIAAATDAEGIDPAKCSILPNIPYTDSDDPIEPCPPNSQSKEILVVATFGYAPNSEAIEHFLKHNWPVIRNAVPDATLRIVGSGIEPSWQARWSAMPGVVPVGFVADLRDEYARSAFSIVPVQRGGGTKIKAIECFAFGRTCVVTPHSHRGIESLLRHGQSLWRADDDQSFANGCIQLLTHPQQRNAFADRGHQLVREHYSFGHFRDVIGQAFVKVGLPQNQALRGQSRPRETFLPPVETHP